MFDDISGFILVAILMGSPLLVSFILYLYGKSKGE